VTKQIEFSPKCSGTRAGERLLTARILNKSNKKGGKGNPSRLEVVVFII
jgi:hypothetical protein